MATETLVQKNENLQTQAGIQAQPWCNIIAYYEKHTVNCSRRLLLNSGLHTERKTAGGLSWSAGHKTELHAYVGGGLLKINLVVGLIAAVVA